jgi:hypothetical protein
MSKVLASCWAIPPSEVEPCHKAPRTFLAAAPSRRGNVQEITRRVGERTALAGRHFGEGPSLGSRSAVAFWVRHWGGQLGDSDDSALAGADERRECLICFRSCVSSPILPRMCFQIQISFLGARRGGRGNHQAKSFAFRLLPPRAGRAADFFSGGPQKSREGAGADGKRPNRAVEKDLRLSRSELRTADAGRFVIDDCTIKRRLLHHPFRVTCTRTSRNISSPGSDA